MKKGIIALGVLSLFVAFPAYAADVRFGEQISILQNEVLSENVYVAGGQITASGELQDDFMAVGGRVVVTGAVAGDVGIAGGTVDLFERVGGDVRIAGGQVTIGESVTGDVVVLGGSVSILPGAVIGGDLLVLGGAVFLDGTVNGDMHAVAGEAHLHGLVAGNVDARVERMELGESAKIGGNFTYRAVEEVEMPEGAAVGGTIAFTKIEQSRPEINASVIASIGAGFFAVQFLMFAVAAFAVFFLLPKLSRELGDMTVNKPWKHVGLGFAALILTPLVALILVVTILGALAGGIVFVAYLTVLALAKAMSAIVVGSHLSRWIKKETTLSWQWVLGGVVAVQLCAVIPIIGWIAVTIFFLMTFGALTVVLYEKIKHEHH